MEKVIKFEPVSSTDFSKLSSFLQQSHSISDFVESYTEYYSFEEIPTSLQPVFIYEYHNLITETISYLQSSKSAFQLLGPNFKQNIKEISKIVQSASKINAFAKGIFQRKKYYDTILNLKLSNNTKHEKSSNESIIRMISSSVVIRKLTLEQCFRAADSDYDGKVTHNELKSFFEGLKLSIPSSYITRFLLIVDEDCTGIITQEEYHKTLAAFSINSEIHGDTGRVFQHDVLVKFSDFLKQREIEPDEIFNLCDTNYDGSIDLKELEKYLNILNCGFQQKEIAALMGLLDSNENGEISRDEFFEYVQRGNKALFEVEEIKGNEAAMAPQIQNFVEKFENGKNTLFDILDVCGEGVTFEEFRTVLKDLNQSLSSTDIDGLIKQVSKENLKLFSRQLLEDFCISKSGTNLLTKKQYIRKIEIVLNKNKTNIETVVNSEGLRGTIEIDELSSVLSKYFSFTPSQIRRFLHLFDLTNYITVEQLQNIINPNNTLEKFSKILEDNSLNLEQFFIIADKKKTGMISSSDFELTAIGELSKIDGKLLTDLALMFPLPKLDKSSFLKIFQCDFPSKSRNLLINAPIQSKMAKIPSPPVLESSESKRKSNLYFLVNERCTDTLYKFLVNCEKNTPTHTFFEKYDVQLHQIFDCDKFFAISTKFKISKIESNELFRMLDRNSIGFIYAYSFVLTLDILRNPLDGLPTQENSFASTVSQELIRKLLEKYDPLTPLYKNFPILSKIVDWETLWPNILSVSELDLLKKVFPVPCFYYQIVAVLQTYQKIDFLCGEQTIMNLIERKKITEQAADTFNIECQSKYSRTGFITVMKTYCSKIEAESIYQYVYGNTESKPIFHFYALFDAILTCFRNKLQRVPIFPLKNSAKSDSLATNYFEKLTAAVNKPLESYNLAMTDENTEIGFATVFERVFKIARTESMQYLKLLKFASNHKIRLYHIIYVLASYKQEGEVAYSYKAYFKNALQDYLPYGASFLYSIGLYLKQQVPVSSLLTIFNFLNEEDTHNLINKIDSQQRGFVFGYEIAAEIDAINEKSQEKNEDFVNLVQEISQKYSGKVIDFDEAILKEMVTFDRFCNLVSKQVETEKCKIVWDGLKNADNNKLAFYAYVASISKFIIFDKGDASSEDLRNIALIIPENMFTLEFFVEFKINETYSKETLISKMVEKYKIDKSAVLALFTSADSRNSGKIFGFEFFAWIDLLRACVTGRKIVRKLLMFPFSSNQGTAKSLQQSLKLIASDLDFNKKSTFSQYSSLENLKVLTLANLISCFQDLPESNIRELYVSLNITPFGVQFYHVMAVIESYRLQQITEEQKESPIKLSARDSKVSISEAKSKLKSYILGDNPKKKVLDSAEIFGIMDKNKDGVISSEEFMSCLDMIHLNLTANEKIILTKEVDRNRDDKINYKEIMDFLQDSQSVPVEIAGLDYSLGNFKDGSLEQAIFKLKLYLKNNPNGPNALENVFQRLDEDKSGGLNDTEFSISMDRLKLNLNPAQKKGLKKLADLNQAGEMIYKTFGNIIAGFQFSASPSKNILIENKEDLRQQVDQIFKYEIVPQQDYFTKSIKSCSTILNSEEAALKRCKELFESCEKFVDPDFGPEKAHNGDICLYWKGSPPSSNYPPASELIWKSTNEWLPNAGFFKGGISSNDVIQGSLGDCWFIGALSVMAQRDDLVRGSIDNLQSESQINESNALGISKGVYPPLFHYFSKKAIYVFKFYLNCSWKWVIIDDRVPVVVNGDSYDYVFGHCKDPSELWVSLIEKAYAKLYGCYEALNGGLIDDALVDLTGYVAEKIKTKTISVEESELLWARLNKYKADKCLMGCSIDAEGIESELVANGEATGLLARHAYALIDVIQIPNPRVQKGRHRIVRLRNPWGQKEWNGKWSDSSDEVKKHLEVLQQELKKIGSDEDYNPTDNNDGSFLMCFKDWRTLFHNLYVCVDFSDEWWGLRFNSEWNTHNSGGVPTTTNRQEALNWAKNPQFIVELKTNSEVFISLSQEDGRYCKSSIFPFEEVIKTACFTIMKIENNEESVRFFDNNKIVKLSVLKLHRNIELRTSLAPGKYCIVPATLKPGQTGLFWLSIYFNCSKNAVQAYGATDKVKGNLIAEEEENDPSVLTPRFMERVKELVRSVTSL